MHKNFTENDNDNEEIIPGTPSHLQAQYKRHNRIERLFAESSPVINSVDNMNQSLNFYVPNSPNLQSQNFQIDKNHENNNNCYNSKSHWCNNNVTNLSSLEQNSISTQLLLNEGDHNEINEKEGRIVNNNIENIANNLSVNEYSHQKQANTCDTLHQMRQFLREMDDQYPIKTLSPFMNNKFNKDIKNSQNQDKKSFYLSQQNDAHQLSSACANQLSNEFTLQSFPKSDEENIKNKSSDILCVDNHKTTERIVAFSIVSCHSNALEMMICLFAIVVYLFMIDFQFKKYLSTSN